MSQEPYITIRNVTFKRAEKLIFDDISVDIQKGKVTAFLGPSGTGKTTLLNLINAQLSPDKGTITVGGKDIHHLSRPELFLARREMGMLFQSGALFTGMSVFDNVAFPLRVHTDLSEDMIRDMVLLKLQAVGLRGARDLQPSELSGGMARRVALARAIVLDPKLILYDEPFTGQDPISMGVLVKLIRLLNDSLDTTSVLVSHDVQEVFTIADYVYILAGGKIIGQGTPADLKKDETAQVKQFIKGLPDGPVPFHYPAPDYAQDLLREGA